MRVISTAELAVLAKELQEFDGFYIEKFYEVSENRFRLRLKRNKEQCNVQVILSHTINKTSYIEKQEQPTNFAIAVRSKIEGFQIREIRQLGDDRIVVFRLEKGDVEFNMIIEMFDNGNVILADKSMNIFLVYRNRQFRDRAIKPNVGYMPPKQSDSYKIEIPNSINPVIFRNKEGKAVDYSITIPDKYKNLEKQEFASLQDALDAFYYENPVGIKEEKENELVQQLRASIEKQKRILQEIDESINESKRMGDTVLNNMNKLNSIINELKRNKRITKQEAQSLFKDTNIIELDLKNKTVTIEID